MKKILALAILIFLVAPIEAQVFGGRIRNRIATRIQDRRALSAVYSAPGDCVRVQYNPHRVLYNPGVTILYNPNASSSRYSVPSYSVPSYSVPSYSVPSYSVPSQCPGGRCYR